MTKIAALFRSRRFWLAMAAVAVAVLNDGLGIDLDESTIQTVVLAIAAWIVGDSITKTV